MTSPGSFGAVVVDTANPDASIENDFFDRLLTPTTRDVDDRRQQLILHLLQKVCDSIDPTPRLFLENVRKLYDSGVLTNVGFLSEMTLDPSLAHSLAQLKHPHADLRRPPERKVGFEPFSKSEDKKQKSQEDLHSLTKLITPTTHGLMFENLFPHEHSMTKATKKNSFSAGSSRKSPPHILRELDVSRSRTDFGVFARVGKGGFGKVYKAQHNMDGRTYAIKKIVFWHGGDAALLERKVLREVKCLAKLDSAYVCRYYGAWFEAVWNQDATTDDFEEGESSDSESEKGQREAFSTTDGSHSIMPEMDDDETGDAGSPLSSMASSRATSPHSTLHSKRNDSFLDMDGLLFGDDEDDSSYPKHSRTHSGYSSGFSTQSTYRSLNEQCKFCFTIPCTCRGTLRNSGQSPATIYRSAADEEKKKPWSVSQKHRSLSAPYDESTQLPPPLLESVRSTPMKIKRPPTRPSELEDIMMSPGTKTILDDERFSPLTTTRSRLPPPSTRPTTDVSKAHQKRQDDAWRQIIDRFRFKICLYIQAQFCEGETLRHWMVERKQVDPAKCMRLFHQMATGLHHVHLAGVIHRDLKPSNIFLTTQHGETVIKIGDFGLAKEEFQQSSSANKPRRPLGTLTYAAPEQIQGSLYCDKADIYSLGIILFELYNVFETGMERAKQMSLVRKNKIPPEFEQLYPEETRLIRWMTSQHPKQRPSSTELLQDPYIKVWDSPCTPLTRAASLPCSPLKTTPDDPPETNALSLERSQSEGGRSAHTSPTLFPQPPPLETASPLIPVLPTNVAGPPSSNLSVLQILRSQVPKSSSSPDLSPPPLSDSPLTQTARRARAHSDDLRIGSLTKEQEPNQFDRMSRRELLLALQNQANTVREQQGRIAFLCSHIAELQKIHHNCNVVNC